MIYSYVLFPNHMEGLKLEKLLKKEKIHYTITPAPRELTTCCGITIRIKPDASLKVRKIIELNNISSSGIQSLEVKSYYNI